MGDFGCLMKKGAMESGGDFWKDRHDEPGGRGTRSSRDFKWGGHYQLSAQKDGRQNSTGHASSLVGHLSVVSCIALHQPRNLYYGERFPLVVPLTASIISFLLILQMISAAPSRSKALLASVCRRPIPRTAQSVRHYTNGQRQEEPVIPSINELLSKKSIKSAWAGERLGNDEEQN